MRFDCGPTEREKAAARQAAWERYLAKHRDWHRHFCWRPTRMSGTRDCRWLEWVERKGTFHSRQYYRLHDPDFWTYEYRPRPRCSP